MGPLIRTCAVFALVAITGCQTTKGSFCQISDPIRLSAETVDRMSDQEVAAVLAHNEKQAKLCGVKP